MANKMIIDASHPEETRVVVLRGNRVEEFDFELASKRPLRGNIYLAKVTRVEPSLQAAFVDYGGNRHGFLAFSEIHPDYYQIPVADRQALLEEEALSQRRKTTNRMASGAAAAIVVRATLRSKHGRATPRRFRNQRRKKTLLGTKGIQLRLRPYEAAASGGAPAPGAEAAQRHSSEGLASELPDDALPLATTDIAERSEPEIDQAERSESPVVESGDSEGADHEPEVMAASSFDAMNAGGRREANRIPTTTKITR